MLWSSTAIASRLSRGSHRGALGHRPRLVGAPDLEPEVPVQAGRVVLLDHEARHQLIPAPGLQRLYLERPLVARLDLERRVLDAEALAQQVGQLAAVGLGVAAGADGDVRGQRGHARRDLPDVQVVDLDDVVLGRQGPADLRRGRGRAGRPRAARGRSRAAGPSPSAASAPPPAGRRCRRRVRTRSARITTPAMAVAMNANRSVRTCWKAPSTLRLRRSAPASIQVAARLTTIPASATTSTVAPSTRGRVDQPAHALDRDHQRQRDERRAVHLGGQDLGALEPERVAAPGGPGREPRGDQRERDRAGVGEHVRRVREQRQRVGQDARHDLGEHEAEDQRRARRRAACVSAVGAWWW